MSDTTVSHLAALAEALGTVDAGWHAALGGSPSSAVIDDDLDAMSDAGLLALNDALGAVERYSQVLHAKVASGISRRSTPELGKEGLARKAGFKTPAKLIAAATGGHTAEARRLIRVGEATAGRITFSGERAPARHPHVAEAFTRGRLSRDAASAITGLLDRLAFRVDRTVLDAAEQTLAQQAQGLALTDVQVILRRAEAWLDPDGLEPKIEDLRAAQYLKIREDANGMIVFDGKFSPDNGAPIKAAVEGLVTAQIRAARGRNDAGASGDGAGQWAWDVAGAGEAGADAGAGAGGDAAGFAGADVAGVAGFAGAGAVGARAG
jgi:hypothetical protein